MAINRKWERLRIAEDKMLGKVADCHERWGRLYNGVTASTVQSVRSELGIPPHRGKGSHPPHPMRDFIKNDPLLGKVADRLLANKYSVSRHLIMAVRKEEGIPGRSKSRNKVVIDFIPSWRSELLKKVGWT